MKQAASFRGQPLLVLVGVLSAWLGLRVALWQPVADTELKYGSPTRARQLPHGVVRSGISPPVWRTVRVAGPQQVASARPISTARSPGRAVLRAASAEFSILDLRSVKPFALADAEAGPVRLSVGHSLLLAAGVSQLELPRALAAYVRHAEPARPGVPAATPHLAGLLQGGPPSTGSRLSADAWLALRLDTTSSVAPGRASYGRSQAGSVVRYSLAASKALGAQAYLRASSALGGALERDLAVGVSARPISHVPVRLAAEARLTETDAGIELRPAVIAVAEIGQVKLPRRSRAEAYLQGGYVGGRFATGFVDGQGRAEHAVARFGDSEIAAGAGIWGGAQKGAARLDAGPTAALTFRVGRARGRLAADYRFRVAGNAEPRSGPALTLSAGF